MTRQASPTEKRRQPPWPGDDPPAKHRVAVLACEDYEPGRLRECVGRGLELLGGSGVLAGPGQRVLVKPNLFAAVAPENALTTHPGLVRVVCDLIREAGASALVGDNPVFGMKRLTYSRTGVRDALRGSGASLVYLHRTERKPVPRGRRADSFLLPGILADFDRIVSLPKLKTHQLMGMTGAVKNAYGLVHGRGERKKLHFLHPDPSDFARMLLDLNDLVNPALHVVDGVLGSDGNGPRFGKPRKAGCLVLGTNALAVDFVLARIAGLSRERIDTLRVAMEEEGWPDPFERIEVLGTPLDSLPGAPFTPPPERGGVVSLLPAPLRQALIRYSRRRGKSGRPESDRVA